MMELHQLRAFREVARARSFTRAASNMFCAQSTITGQIRGLERSLGTELFHRRGRLPVELTSAGAALLVRTDRIFQAVADADQAVRGLNRSDPESRRRQPAVALSGGGQSMPRQM
ncbi:LysR family transcriptional regulator [Streptomyces kunmingensis]|uniref:LysR family transcriptional regulator n=1 Tax=Streptomyces kunmingensis TaxID=68225 RepID=A0ABU6CQN1_9ACTN|nr:LysR family transcriptional regulator [Streptomyces kunmingensis]MEB3967061.1 LysR family transcriptional regulator [Streptomyces kunmingensis]